MKCNELRNGDYMFLKIGDNRYEFWIMQEEMTGDEAQDMINKIGDKSDQTQTTHPDS